MSLLYVQFLHNQAAVGSADSEKLWTAIEKLPQEDSIEKIGDPFLENQGFDIFLCCFLSIDNMFTFSYFS